MKAKHASWEQKIKFSNTIKKQQNVLKKLKLQQQLSEKKKKNQGTLLQKEVCQLVAEYQMIVTILLTGISNNWAKRDK